LHESVELRAETVLERLQIALFLAPFGATIFEPDLPTPAQEHRSVKTLDTFVAKYKQKRL